MNSETIPHTTFKTGDRVMFLSIHKDCALDLYTARIIEWCKNTEPNHPRDICVCIQFDIEQNFGTTWCRIDELIHI